MSPNIPSANNVRRSSERPRRPSPKPTGERVREPDSPTLLARTLPSTATLNNLEMLSAAVEASISTKDSTERKEDIRAGKEDAKRHGDGEHEKSSTER